MAAKKLTNLFYNPMLFFFLLPLFQMVLGSLFSLNYNRIHILSFIFLYAFILFNQMLENILLRIPTVDFDLNKVFLALLEGLNILTLFYFGFAHSWIAALVLLLFSLFIQGQFLFTYYNLDGLAVLLTVSLKVIFLNGFSFYTNTGFISSEFVPYTLALLLPFFLYEASRVRLEMIEKALPILLVLCYITGVGLLWSDLTFMSAVLFVSLPFAWGVYKKEFNRKTTSMFAISFSLLYILLLFIVRLQ